MALAEDKIKGYKHFANKLWNITRFTLSAASNFDPSARIDIAEQDKATLLELNSKIEYITKDIEEYRFYMAGEKLYHYIWHNFADIIIEESKKRLAGKDSQDKDSAIWTLLEILKKSVIVLHPFMPFITEEIWSMLPNNNGEKMLIIEKWPNK